MKPMPLCSSPLKGHVCTTVYTRIMTVSYFIRPGKSASAKIHVLISEGRGRQHRLSSGNEVKKASHWNQKTQLVRTVASESHDIINHQLKRLKAHVESCFYEAKAEGQRRDRTFYEVVMDSFSSILRVSIAGLLKL